MILQALNNYYYALLERGDVASPGWSTAKVSYALRIDEGGALRGVGSLKIMPQNGKKEIAQTMLVPEQQKKSSGILSNFLCENSSYFLGIDEKGKPERSVRCFEAARTLHHEILDGVDSPAARAILAFFDNWKPEAAKDEPVLSLYLKDITQGANLVFLFEDKYVHDDPAIRAAWHSYRSLGSDNASLGLCLVTGKQGAVARLHPAIKGVRDAQATGASLVSFNEKAFESYGHEASDGTGQGMNSPVSEEAAFAYGTALNHLIADREHLQYIGDSAVVFWAEDAEPLCQDIFSIATFGGTVNSVTNNDVRDAVRALARGSRFNLNGTCIYPDNDFYILGLAPNAGRLSVRFFLHNTFGRILANVEAHNERLNIVKPAYIADGSLPVWKLLGETVNQKSKKSQEINPMAGALTRSIISGAPYPATLLEQTMLRIRAERNITYGRAAILKAIFLRNQEYHVSKEVLTVELNEKSDCLPYLLGRLFAVLERVQHEANPLIKSTIRDKYFNSACSTPATIFPLLTKLSQSHLRKLNSKSRAYYEGLIGRLECSIHETLPTRLSLADQGTFHLGYYHQVQKIFEKKDKEN